MKQIPPADLDAVRNLAKEAQGLLENKAFAEAILRLRKQWYAELMQCSDYTLTAQQLHAKLQALEAIPAELTSLINDSKMAHRRA